MNPLAQTNVYESNGRYFGVNIGLCNELFELDEDTNRSTKSMDEESMNPVAQTKVYESNGGYWNEEVELDEDTNRSTKSMDEEVKSLKSWFLKLINHDEEILDKSKVDVDGVLKKILDESQARDKEFREKQKFFKAVNDEWKILKAF
ncbi:hypothetical protein KP509_1Z101400 [Ceratopteris richardii]|nr:hypothetical protein KP509_1Z101400 [Ceratopteris richardii]